VTEEQKLKNQNKPKPLSHPQNNQTKNPQTKSIILLLGP